MKPDNNGKLFGLAAEHVIPEIAREFKRRALIGSTVSEVAESFDNKIHEKGVVTDPTMYARLIALRLVQQSRMGVAGFEPLRAVDVRGSSATVRAKAAPHHDEYYGNDGNNYRTRAIQFEIPNGDSVDNEVVVLGLNFYLPDGTDGIGEIDTNVAKKLIIVDSSNNVVNANSKPITGDTSVFAVLNTVSGDAKMYSITPWDEDQHGVKPTMLNGQSSTLIFVSPTKACVTLPDSTIMRVEEMSGELMSEAISEFDAANRKIQQTANPNDILDSATVAALRNTKF